MAMATRNLSGIARMTDMAPNPQMQLTGPEGGFSVVMDSTAVGTLLERERGYFCAWRVRQ